MGPRLPLAMLAAALLALAGCGDTDTTIINETNVTSTTDSTGGAAAGAGEAPATTATVPGSTTVPPAPEEPEQEKDVAEPEDDDYSGPCGEAAVVTGGTPGPSARTTVPGYANLATENASCSFASTVAVAWIDGWDASCVAGCSRRIEGLNCEYAGSGSSVQCLSPQRRVSFALGFQIG